MKTTIEVPIYGATKKKAKTVFKKLGLTQSRAITLFFEEVKRQGRLPFPISDSFENKLVNPRQKQRANQA